MHIVVSGLCIALCCAAVSLTPSPSPCPLHASHFLGLRNLPTHGKTAVSEANHACAGNWQCRHHPTCCQSALAHCGNVHVQEITRTEEQAMVVPPVQLLSSQHLVESGVSLSFFASAALNQLADVASSPYNKPIPSASAFKPRAGLRLMPVVEMWQEETPQILSSSDRWELKAIFRSARSSANEDVLALLLDFKFAEVLALHGDASRFYAACSETSRRPFPAPTAGECATDAFAAVYATLRANVPNALVITAVDEGAVEAGTHLGALLSNATQIQTLFFKPHDTVNQTALPPGAEAALCTVLCPSLDVNGKPRKRERQSGAEYIYVNMPGGVERSMWLAIVATLVLLGSWNGSCELAKYLLISASVSCLYLIVS
eukprot:Gregarina_sp_Pseudo_9__1933@NODE_232_length_3489_cov_74_939710_g216_i0_p2_GENE_NODE_232_length_3489_cov_74_939710_g216_i0NODE_232_length_3489_cov_74_939710_g216_i0_p2_ORF_typecomplete_len374_score55_70YidD/PF01809_18/12YidD/PF01809_18/1e02_NODE_232_length_3489_cov_74_939710_g216_i02201341